MTTTYKARLLCRTVEICSNLAALSFNRLPFSLLQIRTLFYQLYGQRCDLSLACSSTGRKKEAWSGPSSSARPFLGGTTPPATNPLPEQIVAHVVTSHNISDFCVPQLTPRPRIQRVLLRVLGFSVVYSASSDSVWFTPRPRIQCGLLRVLGFSVVYSAFSDSVWFTPHPRIQCGLLRILGFSVVYSESSDSVWFTPPPWIQCGLLRVLGFSVVYSARSIWR